MAKYNIPLKFSGFFCRFVFVELPEIRKDVQCPICLGTFCFAPSETFLPFLFGLILQHALFIIKKKKNLAGSN